jgi:hypothetical protein
MTCNPESKLYVQWEVVEAEDETSDAGQRALEDSQAF